MGKDVCPSFYFNDNVSLQPLRRGPCTHWSSSKAHKIVILAKSVLSMEINVARCFFIFWWYLQTCKQELFRVREISCYKSTLINILSTTYERNALKGRISECFFPDALKTLFWMKKIEKYLYTMRLYSPKKMLFKKSVHQIAFSFSALG